ncbi:RedY protein [Streptomyces carminius]|uniref:RedY protein n=1 Tax=Streptomyces carminius TaxID=2665496 RepID=A0A2M8LWL9_9ACTN|nr:RedY protein [Streptomyces carminius]PJE96357.1 RedY protein [Streptomyces carminius]
MTTIVHRIRLHEGVDPADFEAWVRDTDYAACPELPSVLAFGVQRVVAGESGGAAAPVHFFELIEVTSREEFERDMQKEVFRSLVTDFDKMAVVVDELVGERVEPGYRA